MAMSVAIHASIGMTQNMMMTATLMPVEYGVLSVGSSLMPAQSRKMNATSV